jgi:acetylornithine deacetylase/succinyl-diaminopimelate desuccinylase-like protein
MDSKQVLDKLDRTHLVEMTRNLADIVTITGEEQPVAEYLGHEFERLGMEVEYQEVEEGRPNVIGTLRGSGGGGTLMFNGHMDHFDNPEPTRVTEDRVYGRGLVNMKCAFPCYITAVDMLIKSQAELKGDIIISGVVGEIEKAQINRFHGKSFRGAGVGARYLMDHGVTADMCIIGEPTGLRMQIGNAGLVWAEVTVEGPAKTFVLKAFEVAKAIQAWEADYQKQFPHPFMLPTVQIGAIDGGNPFKPGTNPVTKIYVIVKTLPKVPTMKIQRELEKVCAVVAAKEKDITARVKLYLTTDGYEIPKEDYVVRSMGAAHKEVNGKDMEFSEPVRYGITSDGSRIHQYGVSVITYGAGFGTHLVDPDEKETGAEWDRPSGTRRGVGINNMVRCSSVYALSALDICSKTREELNLR